MSHQIFNSNSYRAALNILEGSVPRTHSGAQNPWMIEAANFWPSNHLNLIRAVLHSQLEDLLKAEHVSPTCPQKPSEAFVRPKTITSGFGAET